MTTCLLSLDGRAENVGEVGEFEQTTTVGFVWEIVISELNHGDPSGGEYLCTRTLYASLRAW